jgi:glycosyltransferase involved in cell wall biosynthesis
MRNPRGLPSHVLFVVENYPVPADTRVALECRALQEEGVRVSAISPTGKGWTRKFECVEGVDCLRFTLPRSPGGALGYVLEYALASLSISLLVLRTFLRRPFQVLHFANPPDFLAPLLLPYKLLGVRMIFDQHDLSPELYCVKFGTEGLRNRLMIWIHRLFEKLSYRLSDVVIAPNELYGEIAVTRGRTRPDRISVVRNVPNFGDVSDARSELREDVQAFRERFEVLVGYVGEMEAQDNLDAVVDSADFVVNRSGRGEVGFLMVGTGTQVPRLRKRIEALGLEDHVLFTGFVAHRMVPVLIDLCDVCVNPELPNAFSDKSTMIKVLEYMSRGRAVVQFARSEARITAGSSSLYARDNEGFSRCVHELVCAPELRKEKGRSGKRLMETRFTRRVSAGSLIEAYRSLGPGKR